MAKTKEPTSSLSYQTVLGAARDIHRAWAKWQTQDGPMVIYDGAMTKSLSAELYAVVKECVDKTADKGGVAVEPEARRLMLVLDDIGNSFLSWEQGASKGLSSCRPIGSPELLNAFRSLDDTLQERPLPAPLGIKQLLDQGAPHAQIAIKYGWKAEDGSPDIQRVYEEIAEPGKHFNPKTWVHPAHAAAKLATNEAWKSRKPRGRLFGIPDSEAPKPIQRTMEEMIQARAPVAQIAHLFKVEPDEVLEMAKMMNIDLTQERVMHPATEGGRIQEAIAEQERKEAGASV